jgi:hypothetical protein
VNWSQTSLATERFSIAMQKNSSGAFGSRHTPYISGVLRSSASWWSSGGRALSASPEDEREDEEGGGH